MAGSRFFEVQLRVTDLEVSARFYQEVIGVRLEKGEAHAPANEPHYEAEWGRWGEDGFALFLLYPARDGRHSSGVTVGFSVADLDQVHANAGANGVRVIDPPQQQPWGRNARYEDPDGNVVTLTEAPRAR